MISAIVFVPDGTSGGMGRDHERLVRSLAWLVSAVVSGVVRDVTLAGAAGLGLVDIADQAGCGVVEGHSEAVRLQAAIALGRSPHVLLIESAYQPAETMVGELDSVAHVLGRDASARLLAAPTTPWQRLFHARTRTVGLLAPSERCRMAKPRDFKGLQADLSPGLLFATRAHPIV